MNREIKFRAWDSFNRIMYKENSKVIGSMFFYEENKDVINQNIYMQFTGLHDKNGVPIYESDLIYVNGQLMIVRKGYHVTDSTLELKGFELDLIYGHYAESPCGSWQLNLGTALNKYNTSVIGNEYSNLELLKQKDGN